MKDPARRATSTQLCTDVFVARAPPRSTLLPRLEQFRSICDAAGGRAAAVAQWRAEQKQLAADAKKDKSSAAATSSSSSSLTSSKSHKKSKKSRKDSGGKRSTRTRGRRGSFDGAETDQPTASQFASTTVTMSDAASMEATKRSLVMMQQSTQRAGSIRVAPNAADNSGEERGRSAAQDPRRKFVRSSSTSRLTGGQRRKGSGLF